MSFAHASSPVNPPHVNCWPIRPANMAVYKNRRAKHDDLKRLQHTKKKSWLDRICNRSPSRSRESSTRRQKTTSKHSIQLPTPPPDEPEDLRAEPFHTTGIIVTKRLCVQVTHMLIDTGAASVFISSALVRKAHLTPKPCKPRIFSTGNGSIVHNTYVKIKLYIAGVKKTLSAYVDEGEDNSDHILLGQTAIGKFDMRLNSNFGRRHETRWSIAKPRCMRSRERLVLREDAVSVMPTLQVYDYEEGLCLARRRGETTTERTQRERRERARKMLDRIMANNGGVRGVDGVWL